MNIYVNYKKKNRLWNSYMKKNYVNVDGKHIQMVFYLAQPIFAGTPVCRAKHFHWAEWTWNHRTDRPQCGEEYHPTAAGSQQGVVYKKFSHTIDK